MGNLTCPDCGQRTLVWLEDTDPDASGEYKEARSCVDCGNIVYIVRQGPADDKERDDE